MKKDRTKLLQIPMNEKQHNALKVRSIRDGTTMRKIVNQLVKEYLAEPTRKEGGKQQ